MSNKPATTQPSPLQKSLRTRAIHSFLISLVFIAVASVLCPGQTLFVLLSKHVSAAFPWVVLFVSLNAAAYFMSRGISWWTGAKENTQSKPLLRSRSPRTHSLSFDNLEAAQSQGLQFEHPIGRMGNQTIYEHVQVGSDVYQFEGLRRQPKPMETKKEGDTDRPTTLPAKPFDPGTLSVGALVYRLKPMAPPPLSE